MATTPQDIVISSDATSAIDASNKLRDALKASGAALGDFTVKTVEFNSSGQLTKAVIQQTNAEAQKLTRTYQAQDGALKLLNTTVAESAKRQQDLLNQQKLTAAASQAQALTQQFAPLAQTGASAIPSAMIERLQRAQQALVKTLAFSGLPQAEIQRIITDLSNGIVKVETGPAAQLQRAFARVLDTTRQINQTLAQTGQASASQKVAQQFAQTVSAQVPLQAGAAPSQIAAYQAALQRLQQVVTRNNLDLTQLNAIFNQLRTSPAAAAAAFASLSPAMQQAQQAMTQVIAAAGGIGPPINNADTAFKRFFNNAFIGAAGLAKLLQTQLYHRIFGALVTNIQQGITEATQLQVRLAEIQTISQDTPQSFTTLSNAVRRLSDEFGRSQTDVAAATYQTLSNQVAKGSQAFEFVGEAARFARISVSSVKDAVDLGSSAIKSFGLSADQARPVFDSFFKTIELGRVTAQDLANTYGRVGPAAAAAGVSINELNALIATVSVKGVTPSESITQVSALLSALTKPSDALKKLFNEIGVSSGQQAVSVLGFQGVLEILFRTLDTGPEKLAELLPNIRALRAAFGSAADGGRDFAQNLDEITSKATTQAEEAKKLTDAPIGRQLLDNFERIKNFFITDVGGAILPKLLAFSNGLILIQQNAGGLGPAIAGLAASIAAAIVVVKLAPVAIAAFSGGLAGLRVSLLATTAAMGPVGVIAGAVAVAIGVLTQSYFQAAAAAERFNQVHAETTLRLTKEAEEAAKKRVAANNEILASFKKLSDETFRVPAIAGSQVAQTLAQEQELLKEANKATTERLKTEMESFFGGMRNNINKLKSEVTKGESAIRRSQKVIEGFAARSSERAFEKSIQFEADPTRQLQSITNRIKQLQKEINTLFAKGDDASLEAARKKSADIEKLMEQRLEKEVDIRKRMVELGKAPGVIETQIDPLTGSAVQRISVRDLVNKFQQDAIRNEQQLAGLERASQARKQENIEATKLQIRTEEDRLRKLQEIAKKIESFSTVDKEGKTKKEFAGPGGLEKGQAQLKNLEDQFKKLAGPAFAAQTTLADALSSKLIAANALMNNQIAKQEADAFIKRIDTAKKGYAELLKAAVDAKNNLSAALSESNIKIIADLEQSLAKLKTGFSGSLISQLFPTEGRTQELGRVAAGAGLAKSAEEEGEKIKRFFEILNDPKVSDEKFNETLKKTQESVVRFSQLMLEFTRIRTTGPGGETIPSLAKIFKPEDVEKQLNEQLLALEKLKNARQEASKTKDAPDQITRQVQELQVRFEERFPQAVAKVKKELADLDSATKFNNLKTELDSALTKFDTLVTSIDRNSEKTMTVIIKYVEEGKIPPEIIRQREQFVEPERRAAGGPINWTPRGTDRIPAMLSAGEFVVNARSTRRWFTQLMSINAGFTPRYFASGGPVNVGDINLNFPDSSPSETNVRELGRAINREIRRGTINFNATRR